jgi:hypothetical protein
VNGHVIVRDPGVITGQCFVNGELCRSTLRRRIRQRGEEANKWDKNEEEMKASILISYLYLQCSGEFESKVPVHTMKAYKGSGGVGPHILKLRT